MLKVSKQTFETNITYLFAVKTLVENDTEWPNVDFWRDFGRRFAHHKAFGWQVPVGSCALRRQIHAMFRIVVFRIHDFGQTKVRDFDVTAHGAAGQQNISCKRLTWNSDLDKKWKYFLTWFEIIVNDGWFDFVQVLESRGDLHHNRSRFALRNGFMLKKKHNSSNRVVQIVFCTLGQKTNFI